MFRSKLGQGLNGTCMGNCMDARTRRKTRRAAESLVLWRKTAGWGKCRNRMKNQTPCIECCYVSDVRMIQDVKSSPADLEFRLLPNTDVTREPGSSETEADILKPSQPRHATRRKNASLSHVRSRVDQVGVALPGRRSQDSAEFRSWEHNLAVSPKARECLKQYLERLG